MCFPCRFLFSWIFFLPFFYFPVSIFEISSKTTKKRENSRHCVTKELFAFYLRSYAKEFAKEIFALLCERIICVRSQHSLDIFHISRSGAKRVFVFGVTYLFLHRNKKVTWTIRYKLIGGYYYMCFRLRGDKFTRQ